MRSFTSTFTHFYPEAGISKILESHEADTYLSILTVAIFGLPILASMLFNYPKKHDVVDE